MARRAREPQVSFIDEIDFPPLVDVHLPDGRRLHTLPGQKRAQTLAEVNSELGLVTGGGVYGEQPREDTFPALIYASRPHCFVIKMTRGSFRDYTRSCLLHCGISDSRGMVFNFDERGHHRDTSWRESICVPLNAEVTQALSARGDDSRGGNVRSFDRALAEHDAAHIAAGQPYHDNDDNCYHYAVGFLNHVRFRGRTDHTIHSIERELLTAPCVEAVDYLKRYMLLTTGAASGGAAAKRAAGRPALCVLLETAVSGGGAPLSRAGLQALLRVGGAEVGGSSDLTSSTGDSSSGSESSDDGWDNDGGGTVSSSSGSSRGTTGAAGRWCRTLVSAPAAASASGGALGCLCCCLRPLRGVARTARRRGGRRGVGAGGPGQRQRNRGVDPDTLHQVL